MTEPLPEAATLDEPAQPPEQQHAMSPAAIRGHLMPLAANALALRNGLEFLLEHPHVKETLGDLEEPLTVLPDKLWRTMLAALARSS